MLVIFMQTTTQRRLSRNIWLYGGMKVFTKRVFLPLVAIYLVDVGGLRLNQIAILATLFAVVSIIAEVPTGYFADRITRKASLTMSALFLMAMSSLFAFSPSFTGAVFATIFEAIGYAFLRGAAEALIHDTLVLQNRASNYTKIVARAQSIGLVGNIILVSIVSLTYKINPQMPFIISIFLYASLFILARNLYEPPRDKQYISSSSMDLFASMRLFVTKETGLAFLVIGLLSGFNNGSTSFTNLAIKNLGISPGLFGMVFSAGSGAAVIMSIYAGRLRKMSLKHYQLLDLILVVGFIFGIGITQNLYFAIPAFIVSTGFWRLRNIVYQHHLLDMFPGTQNKATLISTLSFFGRMNEVWIPLVFGYTIGVIGYSKGFVYLSVGFTIILIPMIFYANRKKVIDLT